MGEAIGQSLPIAVGIALSPLPIVAVVLMLATPRGRANGIAFVLAWLVAVFAACLVIVLVTGDSATSDGQPADGVSWVKLALGVLLLGVGVRQWRGRPHGDQDGGFPKWMRALDTFTWPKAAGAAVVLSLVNPKNLLLVVAGAAAIAQTDPSSADAVVAAAVFAVIATVGVALPLGVYVAAGDRSAQLLERMKDWLAHNNAVILSVIILIIGFKLIGDAIAGLSV